MPHYLYKLEFTTSVRFGAERPGVGLEKVHYSCHADTMFSALCRESLALSGQGSVQELFEDASAGRLLISDLLPYCGDYEIYIPKPALVAVRKYEERSISSDDSKVSLNKKMLKNLKSIPLSQWNSYLLFLKDEENDFSPEFDFAEKFIATRISFSREGGDNKPYSVAGYSFKKDCGLCVIVYFADGEIRMKFEKILSSLQYSGIGGKRSSGYGKFRLREETMELGLDADNSSICGKLSGLLARDDAEYHMTLSVLFPQKEELIGANQGESFYNLIPRQGFVDSETYSTTPVKKRPFVMFDAGSCFRQKMAGDIVDVSKDGAAHPVYRYGKALMAGVTL